MKRRELGDYVQDILDSINEIEGFVSGMDFEAFAKDRKTVNAVVRSLEVIGEAVKRIPENTKRQYPGIPWKRMAGMRDKLIHEYFGIDLEIVWAVIGNDLLSLRPKVLVVLKDVDK